MAAASCVAAAAAAAAIAPAAARASRREALSRSAFVAAPLALRSPRLRLAPGRSAAARAAKSKVEIEASDASKQGSEIIEDLKLKWEKTENKPQVILYGGAALVALWFSSAIVGGINSIPLLPKLLELVGLGYTGWFVYRYLLLKESRKELLNEIEDLKAKITGELGN